MLTSFFLFYTGPISYLDEVPFKINDKFRCPAKVGLPVGFCLPDCNSMLADLQVSQAQEIFSFLCCSEMLRGIYKSTYFYTTLQYLISHYYLHIFYLFLHYLHHRIHCVLFLLHYFYFLISYVVYCVLQCRQGLGLFFFISNNYAVAILFMLWR